jgi:hypothetical protein
MEKHSEPGRDAQGERGGKRKYEPPEIQSQEVFETTALACGKLPGQGGACALVGGKKTS